VTTSTTPKHEERSARDRLRTIETSPRRQRQGDRQPASRRHPRRARPQSFARAIERFTAKQKLPVVHFNRGESKEQTARRYIDMTR
jgi:hypothetical protein